MFVSFVIYFQIYGADGSLLRAESRRGRGKGRGGGAVSIPNIYLNFDSGK